MYIYTYIYISMYIYIYTYTHTYCVLSSAMVRAHTSPYPFSPICMHNHVHTCMHRYIQMYTFLPTPLFTYIYAQSCTHMVAFEYHDIHACTHTYRCTHSFPHPLHLYTRTDTHMCTGTHKVAFEVCRTYTACTHT